MISDPPKFILLADGMGEPGIDVPMSIIVLGFAAVIGLITAISRWLGASRKLAICIPTVPLGLLMVCTFWMPLVGQGGAVPMLFITGPAFVIALAASFVTAFVTKGKKRGIDKT